MKYRYWLVNSGIIILSVLLLVISELGFERQLRNPFLREKIYPFLEHMNGILTDVKFHVRGPRKPRDKIVIVDVGSDALREIGRWPWDRDIQAYLLYKILREHPKIVGLDIMYSEEEPPVPERVSRLLEKNHLQKLVGKLSSEDKMAEVFRDFQGRLVPHFETEAPCVPYLGECPQDMKGLAENRPTGFEKFAIADSSLKHADRAPFVTAPTLIFNLPRYNELSRIQGHANFEADADGVFRRSVALLAMDGRLYPSLSLAMAAVGRPLKVVLDGKDRLTDLRTGDTAMNSVSSDGRFSLNYYGPEGEFKYVSARDVLSDSDVIQDDIRHELTGHKKNDVFKDAFVLLGISALSVGDLRATPFDPQMPGVEIHATALENILQNEALGGRTPGFMFLLIFIMVPLLICVLWLVQKRGAKEALMILGSVFLALVAFDLGLFHFNDDLATSLPYLEFLTTGFFVIADKYMKEENNRKFLRAAFSRYVSPAYVDILIKDPSRLTRGGRKKELTIMFCDIRGFTTFSEKADPHILSDFLNDYLDLMTNVIFETGGTLDKYIGDAIMAFWGDPLNVPDHASKSCEAACKMMKAVEAHKGEFLRKYEIDVKIGIGITTGSVIVGNMGSTITLGYTVIGDSVNLASRLEGATKEYGVSILSTRETLDAIGKSGRRMPHFRTLDLLKVKGRGEAVEIVEVLHHPKDERGLRLFEEGRAHYMGRRWDEAIKKFEEASLLLGGEEKGDNPSQTFIQRCQEFKLRPPENDWDGSWQLESK